MHLLTTLANFTSAHPIIQGALSSALFWLVLKAFEIIWPLVLQSVGVAAEIERHRKYREYIYLRYTSMDGLLNTITGHQVATSKAFRGLLTGLMFICVALLIGGSTPFVWGICLAAALFYFGSALTWLIPRMDWLRLDTLGRWKRIGQLEEDLLGKVQEDTKDCIAKFDGSKEQAN